MGIMPADRELKWQRVFRRFGLPGDKPEQEIGNETDDRARDRAKPNTRDSDTLDKRKPKR
jgi:hypothetical protein